jgi:hypothetical protein
VDVRDDDALTRPLPAVGSRATGDPGVVLPPADPDPQMPSGARIRSGRREPPEVSSEAVRHLDLITAAVIGAFVILLAGVLVATLW